MLWLIKLLNIKISINIYYFLDIKMIILDNSLGYILSKLIDFTSFV
jgi:hypothetical protein